MTQAHASPSSGTSASRRKPPLSKVVTTSRRFYLERSRDTSGVSGLGIVADGCEYPSGKVTLAWRGAVPSIGVYDTIADVVSVHGHGGDTQVVWLDAWPEECDCPWAQLHAMDCRAGLGAVV